MENVPWHDEVLGFVYQFAEKLDGYDIACEHEHSNCVLIAKKKVCTAPVQYMLSHDICASRECIYYEIVV